MMQGIRWLQAYTLDSMATRISQGLFLVWCLWRSLVRNFMWWMAYWMVQSNISSVQTGLLVCLWCDLIQSETSKQLGPVAKFVQSYAHVVSAYTVVWCFPATMYSCNGFSWQWVVLLHIAWQLTTVRKHNFYISIYHTEFVAWNTWLIEVMVMMNGSDAHLHIASVKGVVRIVIKKLMCMAFENVW